MMNYKFWSLCIETKSATFKLKKIHYVFQQMASVNMTAGYACLCVVKFWFEVLFNKRYF